MQVPTASQPAAACCSSRRVASDRANETGRRRGAHRITRSGREASLGRLLAHCGGPGGGAARARSPCPVRRYCAPLRCLTQWRRGSCRAPENQIMDLLTRRRRRLFCEDCHRASFACRIPETSRTLLTRSARPRDFTERPTHAPGAARRARTPWPRDVVVPRADLNQEVRGRSRSNQASSYTGCRRGSASGSVAMAASAASHRSARLRIASALFLSFVCAASRRQRSACALNSLASTFHLVSAMAVAACAKLTSCGAGCGHGAVARLCRRGRVRTLELAWSVLLPR